MRGLIAVGASLLLLAACSGEVPSSRPSLSIQNPIASAPTEAPNEKPTDEETAQPTKTPKETPQATEEATLEPSEEPTTEPTEEATVEPSPTQTAESSETPSEAPSGHIITVFAGGGGLPPTQGVAAIDAALQRPTGIAIGGNTSTTDAHRFFLVDGNLGILLTINSVDHTISEVVPGLLGPQGVSGVSLGGPDEAWVADTANNRVVTPNAHGGFVTIAGASNFASFRGDGGPAKRAWLSQPFDVAGPYIADTTNQRIRFIDPTTGDISTVAGNGTEGYAGDGGPAKDAEIANPQAIAFDSANSKLFIADYTNFRIREVDLTTGVISTVAGTGDGTAVPYNAKLTGVETPVSRASAIAVDPEGNVYFPVFWGDLGTTIMRLAPDGTMTLIAGGGRSATPDVDATEFALPDVLGLTIDQFDGSLLICGSDGKVYTVAGVASPA